VPTRLVVAIVAMVLALILYTVGVWAAHFARGVRPWHLSCFWTGLACDTGGTVEMARLAGAFHWSVHSLTGQLAIGLMLVHAAWATIVLVQKRERVVAGFHRFSLAVWTLWLVPFIGGLLLAAGR
jgi:uncharacterized repeat protein (TIGR03987 family)